MRYLILLLLSFNAFAHDPSIVQVGGRDVIIHDGGGAGSAAASATVIMIGGGVAQPCDYAGLTTCATTDPNNEYSETKSNWTAISDTYDIFMIFPFGTKNNPSGTGPLSRATGWSWNAGGTAPYRCCGKAETDDSPDIAHIDAIFTAYPNTVKAMAGFSNGSKMAWAVACEGTTDLDWIGVRSSTNTQPTCSNPTGFDVYQIHGDADVNAPYEGGAGSGSYSHYSVDSQITQIINWRTGCRESACHADNWICSDGFYKHEKKLGGTHVWPLGTAEIMWEQMMVFPWMID